MLCKCILGAENRKKSKKVVDFLVALWYTNQAHLRGAPESRSEPVKMHRLRKKRLTNSIECYIIDKLTSRTD